MAETLNEQNHETSMSSASLAAELNAIVENGKESMLESLTPEEKELAKANIIEQAKSELVSINFDQDPNTRLGDSPDRSMFNDFQKEQQEARNDLYARVGRQVYELESGSVKLKPREDYILKGKELIRS